MMAFDRKKASNAMMKSQSANAQGMTEWIKKAPLFHAGMAGKAVL